MTEFDPDIIPTRPECSQEAEGYFRLFSAVLYHGVLDYATSRMTMPPEAHRASEIYFWFWDDDNKDVGSIHWLCSALGYQVKHVRETTLAKSRQLAKRELDNALQSDTMDTSTTED